MSLSTGARRLIPLAVALCAGVIAPVSVPGPAGAASAERWHRSVPGGWFYWSSPVIADVNGDGSNDVVVGGLDRKVYAWDARGNLLPGWPATATGAVASSPAVGDVDGDGRPEVVTGIGALEAEVTNDRGAINIFEANGQRRCSLPTNTGRAHTAVLNGPALGDVTGDGVNDIVFGSFDHLIRVVDGRCGLLASFDNRDSIFSAPALYDVTGDGTAEIFIGGDATENRSVPGDSHDGGYFRSLTYRPGHNTPGQFNLVQRWQRVSTEAFQSSAAIGDVDGDGDLEVVTGSGGFYCRHWAPPVCGDSNKVWAFDLEDGHDTPGWPKRASFETTYLASPALGDIDGDGKTDVAVVTNQYDQNHRHKVPNGGAVDVFFGDGRKKTHVAQSDGEILTPPVIADLDGGNPEVIIGYAGALKALNQSLNVVHSGFAPGLAHKSAAAVGDLGGQWALVTTSFDPSNKAGHVHAYNIAAPASAPWPQFQMDPRRRGNDVYAPHAPKSPATPSAPVTAPPPPSSTTTKPKPKPQPAAKPKPAPATTATTTVTAPPPPETTTTLAPETTTTLAETTTTTDDDSTRLVELTGREAEAGGAGVGRPLAALAGLLAIGGGGLFVGWRRRGRG